MSDVVVLWWTAGAWQCWPALWAAQAGEAAEGYHGPCQVPGDGAEGGQGGRHARQKEVGWGELCARLWCPWSEMESYLFLIWKHVFFGLFCLLFCMLNVVLTHRLPFFLQIAFCSVSLFVFLVALFFSFFSGFHRSDSLSLLGLSLALHLGVVSRIFFTLFSAEDYFQLCSSRW